MIASTKKFLCRLLAAGLFSGLLAASVFAADTKRSFDLKEGEAAQTLKAFAAQAQREIAFSPDAVRHVRTNEVRGEITTTEALNRMLAGTGLVATDNAETGVIVVRKETALPNGGNSPIDGAELNESSVAESKVILEVVRVTGSHLRGLLDGATAQPVQVIDQEAIARTGATNIGDILRYIPQVSSFTTGQASTQNGLGATIDFSTGSVVSYGTPKSMDASGGITTASLRGAPVGATLLLIDSKRVPKTNQSVGRDGFDLNGIPLSAVDRIEVLLDGASSAYGADAMGGVINVILKKYYTGTEVVLGYENTFDSDVAVKTASISHGFGAGKLRGLITASWEGANEMMMRDRDFLNSFDRSPYGGSDRRHNSIPAGSGKISISGSVPLPGLTTTSAAIPAGTDGTNLTVGDYANAGPIVGKYDPAHYTQYASSYERFSTLAKFDYDVNDRVSLYATVRAGSNVNYQHAAPIEASNLSIPAGYPGNPFGVAITLNKVFTDIQPLLKAENDTQAYTVGATGRLPAGWRYDLSLSQTSSHTRLDGEGGTSITAALFNAARAAGYTPNLFYDGTTVQNPNPPGLIESLTTVSNVSEEKTQTWLYSLQVDGPVYELPGGDIATGFGFERREEYADFPLRSATDTNSARDGKEVVDAAYWEVNVPIFGAGNRLPLLHQLNLSGSYRQEKYTSGSTSKNPRVGLAWRPVQTVLLRGSYGEGSKIPTLQQRTQPTRTANSTTVAVANNLDPLRGNTVNPVFPILYGGNPNLRNETSENTTYGVVIEVPKVEGLSLSVDWFDNLYNDRISSLNFNQMVTLYPERITRGTNLPTDPAGWAGVVTAADLRPINVAYSQTAGYDIGLNYNRAFDFGRIDVGGYATDYTKNVAIPMPGGTPSPTVTTDTLPLQWNAHAFFYRNAWGVGTFVTYRGEWREEPTQLWTGSATRWDVQFNYDFDKASWLAGKKNWVSKALADTKLSLTVYNVFDKVPPFNYLYFPDNSILDSRLRRYAVTLRREF